MEQEKTFSLEDALKQLETIADDLENGNLPLMEAMKKYEQGMVLADLCEKQLNEMILKVQQIAKKKAEIVIQPVCFKEEKM